MPRLSERPEACNSYMRKSGDHRMRVDGGMRNTRFHAGSSARRGCSLLLVRITLLLHTDKSCICRFQIHDNENSAKRPRLSKLGTA